MLVLLGGGRQKVVRVLDVASGERSLSVDAPGEKYALDDVELTVRPWLHVPGEVVAQ